MNSSIFLMTWTSVLSSLMDFSNLFHSFTPSSTLSKPSSLNDLCRGEYFARRSLSVLSCPCQIVRRFLILVAKYSALDLYRSSSSMSSSFSCWFVSSLTGVVGQLGTPCTYMRLNWLQWTLLGSFMIL